MTKKNYIAFAQVFAATRPLPPESDPEATVSRQEDYADDCLCYEGASNLWSDLRGAIASIFQADNPAFNRNRFFEATEKRKEP